MAKKRASGSGTKEMASFLICSILSIAAGIGAVVMMFLKWVEVDLFGLFQQQYSLVEVYSGSKELKEALLSMLEEMNSFLSLLGQEGIQEIPGLERVETAALVVLALVGIVILLQVVYLLTVVLGKRASRPLGILAGLLTAALGLGAIGLIYWSNGQINTALTEWQTVLDSFNEMINSFGDWLTLPDNPLLNLKLDANQIFRVTLFPVISGGLGLLEAIFAR